MEEILVRSTVDGCEEPCLFEEGNPGAPLVIGLHTWSFSRDNLREDLLPYTQERGWHLLLPEFRGPNLANNPRATQACASKIAMQDVIDAMAEINERYEIDASSLFLVGASGGGHMALMLAAFRPSLWRFVYAACPISDLILWREQNPKYAAHIEACCGGLPDSMELIAEYRRRSPVAQIKQLAQARLCIAHGKQDPSVSYTQSLHLYNQICAAAPDAKAYLEIFDGGHEGNFDHAFEQFDYVIDDSADADEVTG